MWAGVYAGESTREVQEISLGAMTAKCGVAGCAAVFWEAERLTGTDDEIPYWCCNKSTRALLTERGVFRDIQDEVVRELYYGQSEDAQHFRRHIRAFNDVLTTAYDGRSESI